jgi:uncharacterized membrane protein
MSFVRKSLGNVLLSIGGVVLVAALGAWQFYVFVTFPDAQGGTIHLWLAVGATLVACIAGFFVFSVFLRYDRDDEMHITSSPAR